MLDKNFILKIGKEQIKKIKKEVFNERNMNIDKTYIYISYDTMLIGIRKN